MNRKILTAVRAMSDTELANIALKFAADYPHLFSNYLDEETRVQAQTLSGGWVINYKLDFADASGERQCIHLRTYLNSDQANTLKSIAADQKGSKIPCIKALRDFANVGLREAVDIIRHLVCEGYISRNANENLERPIGHVEVTVH